MQFIEQINGRFELGYQALTIDFVYAWRSSVSVIGDRVGNAVQDRSGHVQMLKVFWSAEGCKVECAAISIILNAAHEPD